MTPSLLWTGFLVLLVLSPLPLGSNRPLAWSALGLAMGSLLLGWAWFVSRGQLRIFWRSALWPPLAVLVLVVVWIVLQTGVLPLPGTNPLWDMAGTALGKDLDPAVGLAPDAAVAGLLKLLTYAAAFWLALQMGRDADRAWQLVRWFAGASACYAAYGLINYFAGNRWLLWYERWAYPGDVTSTFVNRNHYATFAALGMLAATALSTRAFKAKWRLGDRSLPSLNRGVESLMGRPLAYLIVALVVGMAWLQSHSRMGFAAGAAGMLTFMILLRTSGTIRSRWALPAALIVVPLFLIFVSGDGTLARLDATQEFDRATIFARVVEALEHSPWVGYGYGSFPTAFQMFRDVTVPPGLEYSEAHSTYLELAFEVGVPAAAAIVISLGWLTTLCILAVFRRQQSRILPAVGASAAVTVAIHTITDFSAQVPAIACALATLLGVGVAQSWSRSRAPALQVVHTRPLTKPVGSTLSMRTVSHSPDLDPTTDSNLSEERT